MNPARPSLGLRWHSRQIPWLVNGVICIGLLIRALCYTWDVSLWHDELLLVESIIDRPLSALLLPLESEQAAPPLFLISVKLLTQLFGESEYALRIWPTFCSCAALLAFKSYAQKNLEVPAQLIACTLLAFSPGLVLFTANVKPYASDVTCSVILLILFTHPPQGSFQRILYPITVCLIPWFSFPSIFVALSLAATQCLIGLYQSKKQLYQQAALYGIASLTSFLILYLLLIQPSSNARYLTDFWKDAYFTTPWLEQRNIELLVSGLQNMSFPQLSAIPWILLTCIVLGLIRSTQQTLISSGVLAACILAAALQIYPFYGRMLFFLTPFLALLISQAGQTIGTQSVRTALALGLSILFCSSAIPSLWKYTTSSPKLEEVRESFQFVQAHAKPSDQVYLIPPSIRFISITESTFPCQTMCRCYASSMQIRSLKF